MRSRRADRHEHALRVAIRDRATRRHAIATAVSFRDSDSGAGRCAAIEPRGFPIDPTLKLGLVVGQSPNRSIAWGAGPDALSYTRDDQPSNDPELANNAGWDCRTHVEYEGQPAVDWYVPTGTPIHATMDGTATLNIVTVASAFDYYGVNGEPYMGNPDRSRAPVAPFSGVSGGKGVFVEVENDAFVTDYGHLDPALTIAAVAPAAFLARLRPRLRLCVALRGHARLSRLHAGRALAGEARRRHRLQRQQRLQRGAAPPLHDPTRRRNAAALSDGGSRIRRRRLATEMMECRLGGAGSAGLGCGRPSVAVMPTARWRLSSC